MLLTPRESRIPRAGGAPGLRIHLGGAREDPPDYKEEPR